MRIRRCGLRFSSACKIPPRHGDPPSRKFGFHRVKRNAGEKRLMVAISAHPSAISHPLSALSDQPRAGGPGPKGRPIEAQAAGLGSKTLRALSPERAIHAAPLQGLARYPGRANLDPHSCPVNPRPLAWARPARPVGAEAKNRRTRRVRRSALNRRNTGLIRKSIFVPQTVKFSR